MINVDTSLEPFDFYFLIGEFNEITALNGRMFFRREICGFRLFFIRSGEREQTHFKEEI